MRNAFAHVVVVVAVLVRPMVIMCWHRPMHTNAVNTLSVLLPFLTWRLWATSFRCWMRSTATSGSYHNAARNYGNDGTWDVICGRHCV